MAAFRSRHWTALRIITVTNSANPTTGDSGVTYDTNSNTIAVTPSPSQIAISTRSRSRSRRSGRKSANTTEPNARDTPSNKHQLSKKYSIVTSERPSSEPQFPPLLQVQPPKNQEGNRGFDRPLQDAPENPVGFAPPTPLL